MSENKNSSMTLIKVLGFSLALTLVFTLVANTLPQVEGEAPVEEEVNLEGMTMESFVALGETLFNGKGTCTLCHKPPPLGRAPDIVGLNMVETAGERLADERYNGNASDAATYIRESMIDPGIYVVSGWGQKGSNDTVSPMPAVDKAPIQLAGIELDAVIAYLQAKDGNEVTVKLPEAGSEPVAEQAVVEPVAAADTAEQVITKYGCAACHSILDTESMIGPELNSVAERLDRNGIRQSIVEPNEEITEGYVGGIMPTDFAQRMTVNELGLLVDLLMGDKQ